MTIIYAFASDDSQILVADRRLTNCLTGKVDSEVEYKILLYKNPAQGYQAAVAFTGLARDGRKHETMKWLLDVLPKAMTADVSLGQGLDQFVAICTEHFSKLQIKQEFKNTSFVFCGSYNLKEQQPESFIAVVSNAMNKDGEQTDQVANEFCKYTWTRRQDSPSDKHWVAAVRGDLVAAKKEHLKFLQLMRAHRRPISPHEKVKLTIPVLAAVAGHTTTVGTTFLSLALAKDGNSEGNEWSPQFEMLTTMPNLLYASGSYCKDIVICSDDSLVDEMIRHRHDPEKIKELQKRILG